MHEQILCVDSIRVGLVTYVTTVKKNRTIAAHVFYHCSKL